MTNPDRIYWIYIMQSVSRHVLYIGVTSDLRHRVWQHQEHKLDGFTDRLNAIRLVYYEQFDDMRRAIAREKQLKGWRREKKERLITAKNPHWDDLSVEWFQQAPKALSLTQTQAPVSFPHNQSETKGPSTPLRSAQGDEQI